MVPLNKKFQWVNVKQKPFRQVQAHSAIIWHIQELFSHIQAYLEHCVTLTYLKLWYIQNPDTFTTESIFRTPAYLQPWYIQHPAIFRTLAYSRFEAYTESCHTSKMKLPVYNYFHKAYVLKWISWGSFSINISRYIRYVKNYDTQGGWKPWIFCILIAIFK